MNKLWKYVEQILHWFTYEALRLHPEEDRWLAFIQFVKFGIVGISNNAISYVAYVCLIFVGVHYTIANFIGFSVSVINSYYWNNKYVFKSELKRIWWKTFLKTYISYAGTGVILSSVLLFVWVDVIGINRVIAPLINLIITIPINFIINKLWAYRN